MTADSEVQDRAFASTIDAFRRVVGKHPGTGGQLAIRSRDHLLVSVASGRAGARAWSRATTVNVWSVAKAVAAVALSSILADRGHSLESRLADLWPELRAGRDMPVQAALGHRLGLVGLRRPIGPTDLLDHDALAAELATTTPWWEPGTDVGYHSWTYGVVVRELCRRLGSGMDGALELVLGGDPGAAASFVRRGTDHAALVALDVPPSEASQQLAHRQTEETRAALRNPVLTAGDANAGWWTELELPSVKLMANAEGIALALAQLLGRGSVPARDIDLHLTGQGRSTDRVLGDDREFAAGLVVGHADSACPYSTTDRLRYGHDGMGGSFACVDPEAGLVLTWVTNGMGRDINTDPRKLEILEAFDDDTH
ncbi:serine hydrolase domain-containing protein [Nocardioides sp.]|uniref:serine hydrolase domain-containing protein n=1 Tax=Nocardioides sp. TaxID=35761 RepID=UPI003784EE9C